MTASWSCYRLPRCSAVCVQETNNWRCLIEVRHVSWHPQLVACNLQAVAITQWLTKRRMAKYLAINWESNIFIFRFPVGLTARLGNLLTHKRRLASGFFTVSLHLACHMLRLPRGDCNFNSNCNSNFGKNNSNAACRALQQNVNFVQLSIMLMKQPMTLSSWSSCLTDPCWPQAKLQMHNHFCGSLKSHSSLSSIQG